MPPSPNRSRPRAGFASPVVTLADTGWRVVVTHGNGPQVGFIKRRADLAAALAPELPALGLDMCVAGSQGRPRIHPGDRDREPPQVARARRRPGRRPDHPHRGGRARRGVQPPDQTHRSLLSGSQSTGVGGSSRLDSGGGGRAGLASRGPVAPAAPGPRDAVRTGTVLGRIHGDRGRWRWDPSRGRRRRWLPGRRSRHRQGSDLGASRGGTRRGPAGHHHRCRTRSRRLRPAPRSASWTG